MKKYADGGKVDDDKVDYGRTIKDFYKKHSDPRMMSMNVKDMTAKDVANIPKELGLAAMGMAGMPLADTASDVVNASKSLKKNLAKNIKGGLDEPKLHYGKKDKEKKYAKGGSVSSASKRADGCATKGKTRGTMR
jgi:hypothetical protein